MLHQLQGSEYTLLFLFYVSFAYLQELGFGPKASTSSVESAPKQEQLSISVKSEELYKP